jgi:broad specificity phosphatase PhoE
LVPELNVNFVELKRPPKLHGHYMKSFRSLAYYGEWYLGFKNPFLPDGESYAMLRDRIKMAQAHLATYPNEARVVVVSHSVFINLFLVHMCSKRPLTPWGAARTFFGVLTMPNTSITALEFDGEAMSHSCAWRLDTHLATSLNSGSIVPPVE